MEFKNNCKKEVGFLIFVKRNIELFINLFYTHWESDISYILKIDDLHDFWASGEMVAPPGAEALSWAGLACVIN